MQIWGIAALGCLAAGCSVLVGEPEPATDASAIDAAVDTPDAAPDAAPDCAPTVVIRDDFADGTIDDRWTELEAGGTVTEAGQSLEIAPVDAAGGNLSAVDIDLTEGQIVARVEPSADPQVVTWVFVRITGSDTQMVAIARFGGELVLKRVENGSEATNTMVSYVPAEQAVWRIRIASNRVYWEVGPNPFQMSVVREETLHFSSANVDAGLRTSTLGPTTDISRFDDVDIATQPATGWCAAADLRDDLDGLLAPRWALFSRNGAEAVGGNGRVTLSPAGDTNDSIAGLASDARFHLIDSSLAVDIEPSSTAGVETNLELKFSNVQRIGFALIQGNLRMYDVGALGTRFTEVAYDPMAHRWWRVVDNADGLRWEVSPDGAAWSVVRSVSDQPIPLDSIRVLLFAHTPGSTSAPASSFVDRVGEP